VVWNFMEGIFAFSLENGSRKIVDICLILLKTILEPKRKESFA